MNDSSMARSKAKNLIVDAIDRLHEASRIVRRTITVEIAPTSFEAHDAEGFRVGHPVFPNRSLATTMRAVRIAQAIVGETDATPTHELERVEHGIALLVEAAALLDLTDDERRILGDIAERRLGCRTVLGVDFAKAPDRSAFVEFEVDGKGMRRFRRMVEAAGPLPSTVLASSDEHEGGES